MLTIIRSFSKHSRLPIRSKLSQAITQAQMSNPNLFKKGKSVPLQFFVSGGVLLLALQSGTAMADTPTDTAATAAPETSTTTPPVVKVATAPDKVDAMIVTGTRRSGGLKAVDSASPIQVLDSNTLKRTGQPDLIQAMAQNMPSFTAQAFGGDTANLTLSARLRGLSPNDTLVLINGKRRHTTSNLAVLGGPYQGGAAADLNFIPVSAIDHIEVLQDGAAAQYGTDAIAGVVNIILKKDTSGGSFSTTGGQYFDGGGRTGDASVNAGFAPNDASYVNVTAETKFHGRSDRGGIDPRVIDNTNLNKMPMLTSAGDYPYVNHISGDAAYHLNIFSVNAGYDFGNDTELYSFATYGEKTANAFENYRMPNRLPDIYPLGFSPKETISEKDFGVTTGIKGKILDAWNWDLSTTYGRDKSSIGVADSGNVSLYNDTGSTPLDFHAGEFTATQWTTNLDLSREFDVGFKTPVNVAFGAEYRRDGYEIGAGDPGSRYKEGSQSYPGFLLTDAGDHSRNNKSLYVDVSGSPIDKLKLDIAGRYENYSDFGSARIGKITGRYDFTPEIAFRSTISNGFRAPTLAEEYYSATNVSPTSAFVQLAPNSPGAALVGVNGLKAEKSQNYSFGFVFKPIPKATITLDAYQINIRDRIVGSGALYGSGGAINSPAVTAAILANGNALDPTVTQTGINIFSNAVNTRNRGAELVFTYSSDYGDYGRVDWSLAGNYNQVDVTKINQAPSQLLPQTLLDKVAISDLETASPKSRVNFGALWKVGPWSINLRESFYGASSEFGSEDGSAYYETKIKPKIITDLEVSNKVTKSVTVTLGANNLFNQYPNKISSELLAAQRAALDNAAVTVYPSFSPFGINGGYYYARLNYTF
ncbi:TonB-dependent receptor plug domain-containing protein [Aquirhabdus sp.]|uniref:TonB-dependent receptor plug domain-containing protein n=1 Tax=Aquirhabdus sp. TaxID=2824160 RepID=UPI00396C5E4A